ncbi:MMPL family transporter [Shewanella sp. TC10]|uniref:MMPL family transporter n=1 Tax=Shewanella sp. TC10 TaxID=1419739 RepID=UPI00129D9536|nr:transporter permease [Shewanella sp. TC10]
MSKLVNWFTSSKQAYTRFIVWFLLVVAVAAYGAALWQSGAKIQSNILAMLPKISEAPLTQKALDSVELRLADQVYIGLVADDKQQAIAAATKLIGQLQQSPEVFTDIRSGDSQHMQALSQYYFDKRFFLLTDKQHKLLADSENSDQWQQLLLAAQQQLYSSFGYASSALLAQDPLLLFPDNVMALAPSNQLTSEQNILLGEYQNSSDAKTTDTKTNAAKTNATKATTTVVTKSTAIVIAKGVRSAFNPDGQAQQIAVLTDAFSSINALYPDIDVLKAGTLFHAQAATETAKLEVSTIGGLSLIGVMLLVWFSFRSLMPLSLALLTLSNGFLFAVVATLSIFGELHLLTLVFGTSLIGVAIDYSFHFYCEKLLHKTHSATDVIKRITPAMTLALLTSAIAFIAIGFTPFPGMQQVAIFCAAGLLGAYLTLVLAYPLLANHKLPASSRILLKAENYLLWLSTKFSASQNSRDMKLALMSLAMVLFTALGLSKLTNNDDIRNLQQSPASITAEENKLRQVLSGGTDNQFILVSADSEQALLTELASASAMLTSAVEAQELSSFVSLSRYLPSAESQNRNYLAYQHLYQQHLDEIIDQLGLDESIKVDLLSSLTQSKDDLITPDEVLKIAGKDLASLWIQTDDSANTRAGTIADTRTGIRTDSSSEQFGSIILLGGIKDLNALNARVTQSGLSVQLVDKVAEISQLMAKFKWITLVLLAMVCAIAVCIFSFKFGIKLAIGIVSIPACSILLTLACLGLAGSPLSLFHALALILVLGIGIDYSLFFASVKSSSPAAASGVMMAVFMSACSTLLAFGLLALSQTNAIHYFGLTLLFGIGFTFLLAPLISINTKKITREVAHYGK